MATTVEKLTAADAAKLKRAPSNRGKQANPQTLAIANMKAGEIMRVKADKDDANSAKNAVASAMSYAKRHEIANPKTDFEYFAIDGSNDWLVRRK